MGSKKWLKIAERPLLNKHSSAVVKPKRVHMALVSSEDKKVETQSLYCRYRQVILNDMFDFNIDRI